MQNPPLTSLPVTTGISTLGAVPKAPAAWGTVSSEDAGIAGALPQDAVTLSRSESVSRTTHPKRDAETSSQPTLAPENFKPAPKAQWTVLFYQDGDSSLQRFIAQNFKDIKATGASKDVNLVAEISTSPHGRKPNVQRQEVGKAGSSTLISEFRGSLKDPKTLTDFITWGMKAYPAEHTMVLVSGHGSGFLGVLPGDTQAEMPLKDLRGALDKAADKVGKKPDVLAFDACLMGQAEVLHSLEGAVPVVVASEETVGGEGLPYKKFLTDLKHNPSQTPEEFGKSLVSIAADDEDRRQDKGLDGAAATLAAYDLAGFGKVRESMNGLVEAILHSKASKEDIKKAITKTQHFAAGEFEESPPYSDYRDLGDFARHLLAGKAGQDAGIKKAADAVLASLKGLLINEEHEGEDVGHASGLSTWLTTHLKHNKDADPYDDYTSQLASAYKATDFAKDTDWLKLLTWLDAKA